MSVHHRQSIRSVNHLYDEEEETLLSIYRQRRHRKEQRQLGRQKILLFDSGASRSTRPYPYSCCCTSFYSESLMLSVTKKQKRSRISFVI